MNRDNYDLPLTTGSDRAAAFYRDGVDRMLSAWNGAADAFDNAIAEDPGFALAHIARARVHQINMEVAEARAKASRRGSWLLRQVSANAGTSRSWPRPSKDSREWLIPAPSSISPSFLAMH